MDQPHKRPFAGLLSRSGTDRSLQRGFTRTDTASSSLSVSSLDLSDDEKGALGLTTLHEPQSPVTAVADLVFIHGLGGGSRKTWSYSPDPGHYWPGAWLPADPDFSDVRIHTFGYRADWGQRGQTAMDIHEFAQSLIGSLRNNPDIRRTSTRIILVGHSMGGLVAKKAYALARQDPTAADLASRVHSIFFLATPQRGSDMATILESISALAWGKKAYLADLGHNSRTLALINDSFRHFAADLRLWSFYETMPTKGIGGIGSRLVVDSHAATLGYPTEEVAGMDADHRHVCKFKTTADSNYRILRDALLTAVDLIREMVAEPQPAHSEPEFSSEASMPPAEASSLLRSFLGVRGSVEGDLATLQVLKQPGSCEWFTDKPSFASWRAGTAPGILWLTGRPAAGKSVLSAHVIDQLNPPHAYCSYFICKHAKAGESTLSACFRAIAFQMAMHDNVVQQALLQLARDGLAWDQTEDAGVWRRLFVGCIFKLPSISRHFWVIDGVDECANFNALFTKRLLASLPEGLRFFATSRNLEEIERGLASLGPSRAQVQTMSDVDTIEDMRLFLLTRLTELGRPESREDRERMCDRILEKSSGSFLWTRLVLQEFETVWTDEAMETILREIPADLFEVYSRMAQSIEADRRKLALAKSILAWVVLACRPLTVDELRCAVKLETTQTLQNAAKAIPDLCGQLVFVDQHDKVQLIHETVREFLVDDTIGLELCLHKKLDHTRLGSLLLRYLCSGVLRPLHFKPQQLPARPRGFSKPALAAPPADTSLVDYACSFFSDHLYRASSSNHPLMDDISTFLGAEVLFWIEQVALNGDLTPISRTATNLREYLGRRMKYVPPTDRASQLVEGWVTDLIRVAAKFRAQLLTCPSSIHSLIPPLCPSEAVIARSFGTDPRPLPLPNPSGLIVKGLPSGPWDDCLIRIDFQHGQPIAVSHGEQFFAIGLSTGQISVYDPTSMQVLRQMQHPERIKLLEFSPLDVRLASCSTKTLLVWDPKTGTATHTFTLQSQPLAITFLSMDDILGAFHSCELTKWNLETEEHETISWANLGSYGPGGESPTSPVVPQQPPTRAAFLTTPDGVLLALGYRTHPVFILNALELHLLGACEPDVTNNGIDAIVFNPNPEIPALIVSFQDGSLCVFDYLTMEMRVRQPSIFASTIAFSTDGRTLVIGTTQGLLEAFELEQTQDGAPASLHIIYRANLPLGRLIRAVTFSVDGLRFIDLRAQQARVWAPAALVRKSASELESSIGTSDADTALLLPPRPTRGALDKGAEPEIRSQLILSATGKFMLAGKNNGHVVMFSADDPSQVHLLGEHTRGAAVLNLALVEARNMVVSSDNTGRLLVHVVDLRGSLSRGTAVPGGVNAVTILDQQFTAPIAYILPSPDGDRVLVCGHHYDELWEIPSGAAHLPGGGAATAATSLDPASTRLLPTVPAMMPTTPAAARGGERRDNPGSVFQHPGNPAWFVIVTHDIARVYAWADFTELTPAQGIRLAREPAALAKSASLQPASTSTAPEPAIATYHVGPNFVLEHFRPSRSSPSRLYLWPADQLDPSGATGVAHPAAEPNLAVISPAVLSVLRVSGPSTVVFLDVKLWVCTAELESVAASSPPPPAAPPPIKPPSFRSGSVSSVASSGSRGSFSSSRVGGSNVSGFGRSASTTSMASGFGRSASPTSIASRFGTGAAASVAAAEPAIVPHARRHFFALSEWRAGGDEVRCAMAPGRGGGGRDVVAFADRSRVVVVRGGLDFAENVVMAARDSLHGGASAQSVWKVVGGSMHRRASTR